MPKKLIPATLGLDKAGERSGTRGLNWLTRQMSRCDDMPTREQVEGWLAHLPPETLAVMAFRMLNELGQSILTDHELMLSLALLVKDEEFSTTVEKYRTAAFDITERIRGTCHTIREAVLARKAAGWPEWDYETGAPKGGAVEPPAEAPRVELPAGIEDFLAGLFTQVTGGSNGTEG